jgi:hypothetical protein
VNEPVFEIPTKYAERQRPHVAEWFGHRVFPTVSGSSAAFADQKAKRCPFLSTAFRKDHLCVKLHPEGAAKIGNSEGVCTISSTSNGPRQDWIVCPVRALGDDLLEKIVRHLYNVPGGDEIELTPVAGLADRAVAESVTRAVHHADERVFVYFQNKVPKQHRSGGEIRLRQTAASPAMSFDTTIVELLPAEMECPLDVDGLLAVRPGSYGVVELQTADTHGTYKHAVAALRSALDLHSANFHTQLAANPEWARREIEGPNVANVFKRTIYQVAFKFQVTSDDTSVGSVLALPQPVWDSWHKFLGAPELKGQPDGTWHLLDDSTVEPRNWIYVFDVAERPDADGGATPVKVRIVVGTDAATLGRAALQTAPSKAVGLGVHQGVAESIVRRLEMVRIHSGLWLIRRFVVASRGFRPGRRGVRRVGGCRGFWRWPGRNAPGSSGRRYVRCASSRRSSSGV